MPVDHKLVRDLVPDIIEKSGKKCSFHIADKDAYLRYLSTKLTEETEEYRAADQAHALEELADVLEVIRALAVARGFTIDELETVRAAKEKERGGFSERIVLEEVFDPSI